jgi:hypothetical protein
MNTTIIFAVIAVASLCIIFFSLLKKNEKSVAPTLQTLINFAEQNGSEITEHDNQDNLAIGLSLKDNKVYFLKLIEGQKVIHHVNTREVRKPSLDMKIRKSRNNGEEAVETISLIFQHKDSTKPPVKFEFYNLENDSLSVYGEFELAKKWQKVIEEKMKDNIS